MATAILVIALLLSFAGSVVALNVSQNKVARNIMWSQQSAYAAESGLEDALLRVKKNLQLPGSYILAVDAAATSVAVSGQIGGARVITSEGSTQNRVRTMEATVEVSPDVVSFYYGAHIGNKGLIMEDQSRVLGNVFSNGDITGAPGSEITGTAQVAGAGGEIEDVRVGGDAYADECEGAVITGALYGNARGDCSYGSFVSPSVPLAPIPLPITEGQISAWKLEAEAGGVMQGNYTLSGSSQASLGPKKIAGNLTLDTSARLSMTGIVWVTGNVLIKNNAVLRLDAGAFGSNSGILVADGTVTLQNNSVSSGSGQTGSYLMVLSTSESDSAIIIKNNAQADVLYAANGRVQVTNNTRVREITGAGVTIKNNTQIQYDIGLVQTGFVSGSGGGWSVSSWKEIE